MPRAARVSPKVLRVGWLTATLKTPACGSSRRSISINQELMAWHDFESNIESINTQSIENSITDYIKQKLEN